MSEAETSPLDRLQIPEPCPMATALARGERADRRYCEQCDKHVVNFGAITRAQAEAEMLRSRRTKQQLCVRVIRDQATGKVLTAEDLPTLTARLSKTRPPKLAAALALALLQWACAPAPLGEAESDGAESEPPEEAQALQELGASSNEQLTNEEIALLMEFGGYLGD